jgi:hypothetical protein
MADALPREVLPVVELHVHGVSGTGRRTILGDPFPAQVAGDESARIFRRTTPVVARYDEDAEARTNRRTVEAFHSGRFTSGSPSKLLWLLLVPFALLNLARYAMLLPHAHAGRGGRSSPHTCRYSRSRGSFWPLLSMRTVVLRLIGASSGPLRKGWM